MFIFISGTSGSGKSLYAEKRLSEFQCEKKFYIATAKIYDDEMKERVEKHKAMRKNKGFVTIEREKDLGGLKLPKNSGVLIEALTTWLANEMFSSQDRPLCQINLTSPLLRGDKSDNLAPLDKGERAMKWRGGLTIIEKIFDDFLKLKEISKDIILVSDDIFSDGIIYDEATENYIKALAELSIKFAAVADEVIECFAGLILSYN